MSYLRDGTAGFGVLVDEDRIVSAQRLEIAAGDLRAAIAGGDLERLAASGSLPEPDLSIGAVRLEPVIPNPGKILCIGANYDAHISEAGRARAAQPTIFTRFADTQIASGAEVVLPSNVEMLDYEGELAVVIGRSGRDISSEHADEHIAGYAIYNDFSARDWQRHTSQWIPGKNFPGTGAFGPALVTPDEIADVSQLELRTYVNGEVRQQARIADMVFPIPDIIEYVSAFTPLNPGDVIVTGTPGGVGLFREPPEFLTPGDVVEVTISGLGTLTNRIISPD